MPLGENVLTDNYSLFSFCGKCLKYLVWSAYNDLIVPDKFQVKTYFSEVYHLFNTVMIIKLDRHSFYTWPCLGRDSSA